MLTNIKNLILKFFSEFKQKVIFFLKPNVSITNKNLKFKKRKRRWYEILNDLVKEFL